MEILFSTTFKFEVYHKIEPFTRIFQIPAATYGFVNFFDVTKKSAVLLRVWKISKTFDFRGQLEICKMYEAKFSIIYMGRI